jgi:hypothetical protein
MATHVPHEDGRPRFAEGNQLWQLSSRKILDGRRSFQFPHELLEELVKYFNWIHDNPLSESKLVSFQGSSALEDVPKMRAVTQQSMYLYCGISRAKWGQYRLGNDLEGFKEVVEWAEDMMHTLNFEGGASGLLNPMLVARQLGLAERTELTGRDGGPMMQQTTDMTQLDLETLKKLKAAQILKDADEPSA